MLCIWLAVIGWCAELMWAVIGWWCLLLRLLCGRNLVDGKLSYRDFVWFLISEEDKRHPRRSQLLYAQYTDATAVSSLYQLVLINHAFFCFGLENQKSCTCCRAAYTRDSCFAILEVSAEWHEPMISQCTMRPTTAHGLQLADIPPSQSATPGVHA